MTTSSRRAEDADWARLHDQAPDPPTPCPCGRLVCHCPPALPVEHCPAHGDYTPHGLLDGACPTCDDLAARITSTRRRQPRHMLKDER